MTVPSYITTQDLIDALGQTAYMAVFDDSGSGSVATVSGSSQVASILGRSLVWIESWLPDIYKTMPPSTSAAGIPVGGDSIPRLLKDAQLQYALIMAYRRKPEYASTYSAEPGGKMMLELKELMQRIQSGAQRIPPDDSPPETAPANVGGASLADGPRMAITSTDGVTTNNGDW